MTQRLAVNGHNLEVVGLLRALALGVQPIEKACLKCSRIDSRKKGADAISTGRLSFGEVEPSFQPVLLVFRPSCNRFWTFRTSDDTRNRDGDNIHHRVEDINGSPRIITTCWHVVFSNSS